MRVKVYFNLHKRKLSVMHRGRVVAHMDSVTLLNATFKVSEAGRQRVLTEKRKNVHAFVIGDLFFPIDKPPTSRAVAYNPYRYATFVTRDDEQPIHAAPVCVIEGRNVTVGDLA